MKTVFLSGACLTHPALAEAFDFPAWYGGNLDALHDCLTEIGEDTAIVITEMRAADEAGRRILSVITDSAGENPHLRVYLAARVV